jgi:Tfp pilus assembly protein PilF
MLDHLDLAALDREADELKKRAKLERRLNWIPLVVVLGVVYLLYTGAVERDTSIGGLLLHLSADGSVLSETPLNGMPAEVRVSSSGVVWTTSAVPFGIVRIDASGQRLYGEDDFPSPAMSISAFTLDGEEVWAIADSGVLHFDGQAWEALPQAVTSDASLSIAVGRQGVFMIDAYGNLSHRSSGGWIFSNVRDFLPGVNSSDYHPDARLLATPDGSLWLQWERLWRYDGHTWEEADSFQAQSDYRYLLGYTGNRVWSWLPSQSLLATSLDLTDSVRYSLPKIGLQADTQFYAAAESRAEETTALFLTSEGLVQFKDDQWRRLLADLPPDAASMTVAPDGSLWVTSFMTSAIVTGQTTSVLWSWLLSNFPLIVIVLFFMESQVSRLIGRRFDRSKQVQAYLQTAVPDVVEYSPPSGLNWQRWLHVAFFLLLVLVIGTVSFFLESPNGPLNPTSGLVLTVVLLVLADRLIYSLTMRRFYDWLYDRPVGQTPPDDETSLQRTVLARRWFPRSFTLLNIEGAILLHLGRYGEANERFREALALNRQGKNSHDLSISLNNLAVSFMENKRFDAALPLIEAALNISPTLPNPYNAMANLYLDQGLYPERAIMFCQRALKHTPAKTEVGIRSIRLTNYARGLQLAGSRQEADDALSEALKESVSAWATYLAEVYCGVDEVKQIQGDSNAATHYFKQALTLDPYGSGGRMAERALAEMQSPQA